VLIGFVFPECECGEPVNTWFKYSNDVKSKETYGKLVTLNMASGYADTDGQFVYLMVKDFNNGEWVSIGFPIGYWESWKPKTEQKDFIDLEDYLKSLKNSEAKIEKK
jgi:hypothetical protein